MCVSIIIHSDNFWKCNTPFLRREIRGLNFFLKLVCRSIDLWQLGPRCYSIFNFKIPFCWHFNNFILKNYEFLENFENLSMNKCKSMYIIWCRGENAQTSNMNWCEKALNEKYWCRAKRGLKKFLDKNDEKIVKCEGEICRAKRGSKNWEKN